MKNKWWGYLHSDGNIQVKRYFSDQDIIEAYESPFCKHVFHEFECNNREEAIKHIQDIINERAMY